MAELRGEVEESGEVKGLDFELLKKVRSGEFVVPKVVERTEVEEVEEDMDEDAVLDELLKMEAELEVEQAKEEGESEEEPEVERKQMEVPVVEEAPMEPPKSRFKPIVDSKQLKQMRKEQKRRKLAMQAMDKVSTPVSMAPPLPTKKTRTELLAQLRRIQAAKKKAADSEVEKRATEDTTNSSGVAYVPPATSSESSPLNSTAKPEAPAATPIADATTEPTKVDNAVVPPVHVNESPREPSPAERSRSPAPPVKVSDNMFSDDSELSDYNPFGQDSDDDDDDDDDDEVSERPPKPEVTPSSKQADSAKPKRNYFGDTKEPETATSAVPAPLTMDPVLAASLRKVAQLAERKEVLMEEIQTKPKPKGMSLGGSGGVYEFEEEDMNWEEEEEDGMQSAPKKKKQKK